MKRVIHLLLSAALLPALCAAMDEIHSGTPIVGPGQSIAVDSSGNRYVTGSFSSTHDFNMAPGTDLRTPQATAAFITRFNSDGSYAWTQVFDGAATENGFVVRLNASGSVLYAAGTFNSSDAQLGGSGATFATLGLTDIFVLALDSATGNPLAGFGNNGVQTFGGTSSEDVDDIVVLGGTLYFSGTLSSSNAGFGGSLGSIAASGGTTDGFVCAINALTGAPDTSFNSTGVQTFGSTASNVTFGGSMGTTNGNLYISVTVPGTGTGYGIGGSGSVNAIGGGQDGMVFALDSTGAALTGFGVNGVQKIGGITDGSDTIHALTASRGYVYLTGFTDATDFGIGGAGSFAAVGGSDTFVAALDAGTGAPRAGFGTNGLVKIGGPGNEIAESIIESLGTLYVAGLFDVSAGFGGSGGPSVLGGVSTFVAALDAGTGAAVTSFSGDGVLVFGGTGSEQAFDLEAAGNAIFVTGDGNSTDAGVDALGSNDESTVGGFLVLLDRNTGAQTTFSKVSSSATIMPNPARAGQQIDFNATGAGPFFWDFGDGSPQQFGAFVQHVYNISTDTTFTVTLNGPTPQTFSVLVQVPNPGGSGVPNSGNTFSVSNPTTGLTVTQTSGDGGLIELTYDISSVSGLTRAITEIQTEFDDTPGRLSRVSGTKAVHKYVTPGIFIATGHAFDGAQEKAKVRKTIAVSSREVGASGALEKPSSTGVALKSLKGKFLFTKSTADAVTFTGEILLPAGLEPRRPDGNTLSVAVGNVVDSITVTSKGKGTTPSALLRIKKLSVKYPKLPKGTTTTAGGEKALVSMQLSLPDLDAAGFDTEGITSSFRADEAGKKSVSRKIQVAIVLAGVAYEASVPVDYKLSAKGDTGQISGRASAR